MELLTNKLRKRFQEIGSQRDETGPIVIAKFFNPSGAGTWYLIEFSPEDQCFFCYYVTGLHCDECGVYLAYRNESLIDRH